MRKGWRLGESPVVPPRQRYRWVLCSLGLALGSAAGGPPEKKGTPDRTLTVNGKRVVLPGAWLRCETKSDCVWVRASCDDVKTGASARSRDRAQTKVNKACAGSDRGMLVMLETEPPPCVEGVCAEQTGEIGDLLGDSPARSDAGKGSR